MVWRSHGGNRGQWRGGRRGEKSGKLVTWRKIFSAYSWYLLVVVLVVRSHGEADGEAGGVALHPT